MKRAWSFCVTLLAAMVVRVAAEISLTATNDIPSVGNATPIGIYLSEGGSMRLFDAVLPLRAAARTSLPAYGLNGPLFGVAPSNQWSLRSSQIAYISCDAADYYGYIQSNTLFNTALAANVTAILLYSRIAQACNISNLDSSYPFVYTMTNSNASIGLLNQAVAATTTTAPLLATISQYDPANAGNPSTSGNHYGPQSSALANPLGPSPTTAVAMIVLYSITGVITGLFLVVIIVGAIRAHRHPERYGPRNIIGRPRQSRAKGLARAMLDTLPIVKFGEHQHEPVKSTDVELADGDLLSTHSAEEGTVAAGKNSEAAHRPSLDTAPRQRSVTSVRSGIASAATVNHTAEYSAVENNTDNALGCSICTEDFERGEDLRVLPCDHKFHPACIDPWLLNVSGTCPLCRIDLNPQNSEAGEGEDNGELPPPIDVGAVPQRIGMRQSLLIGLGLGGRGQVMDREQRLAVVRRLREQQSTQVPAADESRRRRRFRERFGIRTQRNSVIVEDPRRARTGGAAEDGVSDRER